MVSGVHASTELRENVRRCTVSAAAVVGGTT